MRGRIHVDGHRRGCGVSWMMVLGLRPRMDECACVHGMIIRVRMHVG